MPIIKEMIKALQINLIVSNMPKITKTPIIIITLLDSSFFFFSWYRVATESNVVTLFKSDSTYICISFR